ncbi:Vesicle transport protein GOT1 [Picochlorum sp. SENEW3]|nr:Vesicle transport protein GOT1 [Picochlorum sp. SENEW3]WPT14848.1 Vesicle transport protein GOT1 [Picochlorum sp. SENEW3]
MLDERQKIGVALTGLGALFLFLGMVFLFDRGLLAMGNVCSSVDTDKTLQVLTANVLFVTGVIVILGLQSAIRFFFKPKNYKGTGFFLLGVGLVVWGWTLVGFAIETYGFWHLFSAFVPTVLAALRRVPVLKQILDLPTFKSILNKIAPAGSGLPV